jgi:hypothetical protein
MIDQNKAFKNKLSIFMEKSGAFFFRGGTRQSLIFFIRAQKNKTSHENSEKTYLQIYPSALDC